MKFRDKFITDKINQFISGVKIWYKLRIRMLKYFFLFLFLLFFGPVTEAQQLAAFHDNQHHFYIFDNGSFIQAEYLPVKSFEVGGDCVLYIDDRNRLKMYYKGEISILEVNGADQYSAMDYLSTYSFSGVVKVIENGMVTTITTYSAQYTPQDSLVVFYDLNSQILAVYYNDSVVKLEDGLAGTSYSGLVSNDNIIAYISKSSNNLKAFYHGKGSIVEPYFDGTRYKAGRDIIAYVSGSDLSFNVFYKGEKRILESFPPLSYQTGDDLVAYLKYLVTDRSIPSVALSRIFMKCTMELCFLVNRGISRPGTKTICMCLKIMYLRIGKRIGTAYYTEISMVISKYSETEKIRC